MVKDIMGQVRAMKISKDTLSITNEYNSMIALKELNFIPNVYDFDDWEYNGDVFHYIVMEYIPGINLKELINNKKLKLNIIFKIGLIITNMFKKIDEIGYKYTDVKLENIILDISGKIYFIDFGGLVEKNKPTKEYTPSYNINSWGVNFKYNREMEILFSITMIMIALIGNVEYNPLKYNMEQVKTQVLSFPLGKSQKVFLYNALDGKYRNFKQYERALHNIIDYKKTYNKLSKIDYVLIASIVSFVFVIIVGIRCFLV
ncbi:protein kinase domain-containing protein [Keratinibaculum paraultunense]|nr:AarF/UbiB family protein [Keratinibaculum paraultunense]